MSNVNLSKLKNNIIKSYIIGKNINFFKKQIKGKNYENRFAAKRLCLNFE